MTSIGEQRERLFKSVSTRFESACKELGFDVLVSGADRHGTFVWEAGDTDTLNRILLFGITALPQGYVDAPVLARMYTLIGEPIQPYEAELLVGADDDNRYGSMRVDSWVIFVSPMATATHLPTRPLTLYLRQAAAMARAITPDQLTESYILSRASGLAPGVATA